MICSNQWPNILQLPQIRLLTGNTKGGKSSNVKRGVREGGGRALQELQQGEIAFKVRLILEVQS